MANSVCIRVLREEAGNTYVLIAPSDGPASFFKRGSDGIELLRCSVTEQFNLEKLVLDEVVLI